MILESLNFGRCRLAIAVPEERESASLHDLEGQRIATTYAHTRRHGLASEGIQAEIVVP
jgi:ATP phosphoribosyltransferase